LEEPLNSILCEQKLLDVCEPTDVAEARRVASRAAESSGLSSLETANVALAATELASNLLKHAKSGRLFVRRLEHHAAIGLELSALDRGPGMANVAQCMRDGYSTAGSAGTGLGAIKRLAQQFDIYSSPGQGTSVLAQFWAGARLEQPEGALEFGAVCLPIPGELVSGDAWDVDWVRGKFTCVVVDGLGHGPIAAQAAAAALASLREHRGETPAEIVERAHGALRSTRGAALAVAAIDSAKGVIRFCGVGNISARVQSEGKSRHMVSQNGIVGQDTRKLSEFTYPWTADALLVMHSDGLTSRWDLNDYAALCRRHPALIAGVLFRDFARGRDDATILVAKRDQDRI
jgi:anti-sigma regulatory factor (Ser/Thr protein kinase)